MGGKNLHRIIQLIGLAPTIPDSKGESGHILLVQTLWDPCSPLLTMVTLGMAGGHLQPPWAPSTFCKPEESCQEPPLMNSKALNTPWHTLGVPDGNSTACRPHTLIWHTCQCSGSTGPLDHEQHGCPSQQPICTTDSAPFPSLQLLTTFEELLGTMMATQKINKSRWMDPRDNWGQIGG